MDGKYMTKVFMVDDDLVFSMVMKKALEEDGNVDITLFKTGEEFLQALPGNPDIVLVDYMLPDMNGIEILKKVKHYSEDISIIVISGQDKMEVVVEAYNLGAANYIIKNGRSVMELRHCVKNLSKNVNYRKEVEQLRDDVIDRNKYSRIIGESQPILKVLKLIQKVEKSNAMVLITGETGTGKDLVAKAIHYNSPRKRNLLVTVNMPAIPADLVESELFGHEKGAFTGADSKRTGKFEEANGGTIFLDEIGEMDIKLQSKILQVLQNMKITRLGSNKEKELDVRVIAATNRNLYQQVKNGAFREDLFYRLQGFLIPLPPLRERGDDVVLLARYFLNEFTAKNGLAGMTFTAECLKELLNYSWQGNVRELKSLVERAALISENNRIQTEDLVFPEGVVV